MSTYTPDEMLAFEKGIAKAEESNFGKADGNADSAPVNPESAEESSAKVQANPAQAAAGFTATDDLSKVDGREAATGFTATDDLAVAQANPAQAAAGFTATDDLSKVDGREAATGFTATDDLAVAQANPAQAAAGFTATDDLSKVDGREAATGFTATDDLAVASSGEGAGQPEMTRMEMTPEQQANLQGALDTQNAAQPEMERFEANLDIFDDSGDDSGDYWTGPGPLPDGSNPGGTGPGGNGTPGNDPPKDLINPGNFPDPSPSPPEKTFPEFGPIAAPPVTTPNPPNGTGEAEGGPPHSPAPQSQQGEEAYPERPGDSGIDGSAASFSSQARNEESGPDLQSGTGQQAPAFTPTEDLTNVPESAMNAPPPPSNPPAPSTYEASEDQMQEHPGYASDSQQVSATSGLDPALFEATEDDLANDSGGVPEPTYWSGPHVVTDPFGGNGAPDPSDNISFPERGTLIVEEIGSPSPPPAGDLVINEDPPVLENPYSSGPVLASQPDLGGDANPEQQGDVGIDGSSAASRSNEVVAEKASPASASDAGAIDTSLSFSADKGFGLEDDAEQLLTPTEAIGSEKIDFSIEAAPEIGNEPLEFKNAGGNYDNVSFGITDPEGREIPDLDVDSAELRGDEMFSLKMEDTGLSGQDSGVLAEELRGDEVLALKMEDTEIAELDDLQAMTPDDDDDPLDGI